MHALNTLNTRDTGSQYVAWGVNGTSQYVDSLSNYQVKGDGIWFSFEKRAAPGSLTVANGDQVAIKWVG